MRSDITSEKMRENEWMEKIKWNYMDASEEWQFASGKRTKTNEMHQFSHKMFFKQRLINGLKSILMYQNAFSDDKNRN